MKCIKLEGTVGVSECHCGVAVTLVALCGEREMGRSPACLSKGGGGAGGGAGGSSAVPRVINKGPWTEAEDQILSAYIKAHGEGNWRFIPKLTGISRCGKSCRLRWINYLRPDLKRGNFSPDEDNLILTLHALLGNRWSLIAGRIPCRTDNEIKNYWNTHLKRKLKSMGIDSLSYKVGLTLMPNESDQLEEEDHTITVKVPKVSSSSSSDHHNTVTHGSSALKVNANHPLHQADQRRVSSLETTSTSYGSRSSVSEFGSSSISQEEGVLTYMAPPPGRSTSSSIDKLLLELEQQCARSDARVLCSQHPVNVLGSSESFPLHGPAAENFGSLPGSAFGWEYDHKMDLDLQLLDHAAALNLESLDCFEFGILPLESNTSQNDVQASTPWTSLCLLDFIPQ